MEEMTNKQQDQILQMIIFILESCETLEEAIEKIQTVMNVDGTNKE